MEGDFKWDLQSVDKKELHEFELFGKAGVGLKEGKNKYEYSRGCISNHRSLNLRYIYHSKFSFFFFIYYFLFIFLLDDKISFIEKKKLR